MLFQTKYHYKTPLAHDSYMKSLEFYENYITLFCLEKNILFDNIILTQNHAWDITQSALVRKAH
jgi:hypothetical protein